MSSVQPAVDAAPRATLLLGTHWGLWHLLDRTMPSLWQAAARDAPGPQGALQAA